MHSTWCKWWMLDLRLNCVLKLLSEVGSWWLFFFFLSNTFRVKRSPKKSPLSDPSQARTWLSIHLCISPFSISLSLCHCLFLCIAGSHTHGWASLPPTGWPCHRWREAGLLHQPQVGCPAWRGCGIELGPTRLPSAVWPHVLCQWEQSSSSGPRWGLAARLSLIPLLCIQPPVSK